MHNYINKLNKTNYITLKNARGLGYYSSEFFHQIQSSSYLNIESTNYQFSGLVLSIYCEVQPCTWNLPSIFRYYNLYPSKIYDEENIDFEIWTHQKKTPF